MKRDTPFSDHQQRFIAGKQGVGLFLISLAVLFTASLIGFFVVRWQLGQKGAWPRDLPPLPRVLWLSTLVLIISSAAMQWGLASIRKGLSRALQAGMTLTLALGLLFLGLQMWAWLTWLEQVAPRWDESGEFRFALACFYVLTILHALHVIGGLIPMFITWARSMRGVYSPANHSPVHYVAMYWHFLGGVWIVLYATLLLWV